MNQRHFSFFAVLGLMFLLGAGCSSRSSSPSVTNPTAAPSTDSPLVMGGGDQASKVPSDVPIYPGGMVILVTGYGDQVSVAQSTNDPATQVIEWIKSEYGRRGVSFKSTDVTGSSTNLVFEASDKKYQVRVDAPSGGGGAYLMVTRTRK